MRDLLESAVREGIIPGAVAVHRQHGAEPTVVAVGAMSLDGPPMPADAIMRIQSMTKTVTTVATVRLVEQGMLSLDDDVARWLPELAEPRVLAEPIGPLTDTVAADRPITVRHLLTNTSGYGMIPTPCPLQKAMADNDTEASAAPLSLGADEWLARLSELPLAFQPGEGWRYHHSFGILGILLQRVVGKPFQDHLIDDVLALIGMPDTSFSVPQGKLSRLPAAYRLTDDRLVQTEPAGGGFYAGPPPFDVCHGELVCTANDFLNLAMMLADDGRLPDGSQYLSQASVEALRRDQVPPAVKTPDSFFPGFWNDLGWGFGVAVQTGASHTGRYGWSGGQGTDYFIDPDGTVGILLTQVEIGPQIFALIDDFQRLAAPE